MTHVLERKITLKIFLFLLQIKITNEVANVKTKQNKTKRSMVAHTCNPNSWEGGRLGVQGLYPWQHSYRQIWAT